MSDSSDIYHFREAEDQDHQDELCFGTSEHLLLNTLKYSKVVTTASVILYLTTFYFAFFLSCSNLSMAQILLLSNLL